MPCLINVKCAECGLEKGVDLADLYDVRLGHPLCPECKAPFPLTVPQDAVFPVPPVCTAHWRERDWYIHWQLSGGKRT